MTPSRTSLGRREFLKASGLALLGAASAGAWRPARAAPKPMTDIVVLLPGIMGSVLRKDQQDLWGLSGASVLNAIRTLGRSIKTLKLNDDPPDVDDLGDGVTAERLFADVHLIPGLWKIDGYTKVAQRIADEFAVQRGQNFFDFPYDWRRDNRVAARRLARLSHDWLKAWRERSGNQNAKLILLAHSMGGLVSRYFLECMDGWRDTRMLVTFGTPYRGSLNALNFISNGFKKQLAGLELADLTDLLRSFTSVYQLLPTYPCYDVGDGNLLRVGEAVGIPGVDPQRAAKALAFHNAISGAVDAHLADEAYLRNRYAIHPIVGTYQPTFQSAKLAGNTVELSQHHPKFDVSGDGTVPQPSASPLELDGKGMEVYVAEIHGSLQNAGPVLVQLVGLLSQIDQSSFRALQEENMVPSVSLSVDDAYSIGEPIKIRSRCESTQANLTALLVNAQTSHQVARQAMRAVSDEEREAEFAPLPPGAYRITVSSSDKANTVSDVFIVSGK
jgi:hypothetical protein